MNSLLTHVGNLCKIASRACPVDELDVSLEELSSSSEIYNTKRLDLGLYYSQEQFKSTKTCLYMPPIVN